MRLALLVLLKLFTAGLLVAAAFDVKLPGGYRPRMRVYLLDLSGSAAVPGDPESLTPLDAWRLAAADAGRFDHVAVLAIGDSPASLYEGPPSRFPGDPPPAAPADETDLGATLEAALVRIPSDRDADIVVMTDARATRGDARRVLPACAARGIAVHALAIGPLRPSDARILSVEAPAFVSPKESWTIEVELESGREGTIEVLLDAPFGKSSQEVTLVRDTPRVVRFSAPPIADRAEFSVSLRTRSFEDACPRNDTARRTVQLTSDQRRILVLSPGASATARILRAQPRFSVTESTAFREPFEFDAVVLDDFPVRGLRSEELGRLRDFVRSFGGGVCVFGGPNSFGPGGYSDTPLEEILPVWAFPDETLALVVVLDRSGSMNVEIPGNRRTKIDAARHALARALEELRERDLATVIPAPGRSPLAPLSRDRATLRAAVASLEAGGPTALADSIREAVKLLETAAAPRKHVLLISDGATAPEESDALFDELRSDLEVRRIGLTFVLTGDQPSAPLTRLSTPIPVANWELVSALLAKLVRESLQPFVAPRGPMKPVGQHPETEGVGSWPKPQWINRVSTKPAVELAVVCDDHPILAMRTAGRGRTAAAMFGLGAEWAGGLDRWTDLPKLIAQVVAGVSPGAVGKFSLNLSREGLEWRLSALGPEDGPDELIVDFEGPDDRRGEMRLLRTSRTRWETPCPPSPPGMVVYRIRGVRGRNWVHHSPYPEEYRRLGPDTAEIAEIARRTGGTRIRQAGDFQAGPARRRIHRSGRATFLLAAIGFFLLDLLVSTFWPPRR